MNKKTFWFLLNTSKYKFGKKKGQYKYLKPYKLQWKTPIKSA